MSKVFVLDTEKRPLNPIHSAQARQLLRNKKAAVFRRFPFTIILKESRPDASVSELRLKIDPGAKVTGIALVNDSTGEVVFAAELKHRGFAIRDGRHRGRVAGLYRYNPAPSEPDLRFATHPAQASHKLQIVPECNC